MLVVVEVGNVDDTSCAAITVGVRLVNVTPAVVSVITMRSTPPASKRPAAVEAFATPKQRAGAGNMSTTRYPAVGGGETFTLGGALGARMIVGAVAGGSAAVDGAALALGIGGGGGADVVGSGVVVGTSLREHETKAAVASICCM